MRVNVHNHCSVPGCTRKLPYKVVLETEDDFVDAEDLRTVTFAGPECEDHVRETFSGTRWTVAKVYYDAPIQLVPRYPAD